MVTDCC